MWAKVGPSMVVLVFSLHGEFFVTGLSCYECKSVSDSPRCVSDPGTERQCEKKYCTIYRREYLDPIGKIQDFYRSCENEPKYLNAVTTNSDHRTYYRACQTNFCNGGNALSMSTESFRAGGDSLNEDIHIVPGVGSSGEKAFTDGLLVVAALTMIFASR